MLVIYVATFMLRMITWGVSTTTTGSRALVIAGYCYGLNTMILTLRVFGHMMESSTATGTTHIALMSIIEDVAIIFFQFLVGILAFSLAITKIYVAEGSFISSEERLSRDKRSVFFSHTSVLNQELWCWRCLQLAKFLILASTVFFVSILAILFWPCRDNADCNGSGLSW